MVYQGNRSGYVLSATALAASLLYGTAVAAPQIINRKFVYQNDGQDLQATVTLAPAVVAKGKKAKAPTAFRIFDPATKTIVASAEQLQQSGSLYSGSVIFPGSSVGPQGETLQIWAEDGKVNGPKTEKANRTRADVRLKPYVPKAKPVILQSSNPSATTTIADSSVRFYADAREESRFGSFSEDSKYVNPFKAGQLSTIQDAGASNAHQLEATVGVDNLRFLKGEHFLGLYLLGELGSQTAQRTFDGVVMKDANGKPVEMTKSTLDLLIAPELARKFDSDALTHLVAIAPGLGVHNEDLKGAYDIVDFTKTSGTSGFGFLLRYGLQSKSRKILEATYRFADGSGKTKTTPSIPSLGLTSLPATEDTMKRSSHTAMIDVYLPLDILVRGEWASFSNEEGAKPDITQASRLGAEAEWRWNIMNKVPGLSTRIGGGYSAGSGTAMGLPTHNGQGFVKVGLLYVTPQTATEAKKAKPEAPKATAPVAAKPATLAPAPVSSTVEEEIDINTP